MAAQLDSIKLTAIANHVSQLAALGLDVIDMDTSGDAPVFTVRPDAQKLARLGFDVVATATLPAFTVLPTSKPAPRQAGYSVREF